ncbi:MAG: cobalamin-dependent protein [Bacillota bacterium]
MARRIVGAAIGDCVHVAGILKFMKLATEEGYHTTFLGPAVPVAKLVDAALETEADIIAVGYRLTPEVAWELLAELRQLAQERGLADRRWVFGGTPPVAAVAQEAGFFDRVFRGGEPLAETRAYLQGAEHVSGTRRLADTLLVRIGEAAPYPLLRHHYGRPTLEETMTGVRELAEARVLDIISLGPDQNFQEHFFHPEDMDPQASGAGGVPLRSRDDLLAIYQATRTGNYPLVRCYAGTRELVKMAQLLQQTIHNAWAAIPLMWYNQLDGRSRRPLDEAIAENQAAMAWHAWRGIPVEVNEAHHWSLRDAPDSMAVAMAYLAAYNARAQGVKDYVAQFMFNTPPDTGMWQDLAKMLAKLELIERLAGPEFRIIREVRAGLSSFPVDPDRGRGQLASATLLGMALRPQIVHVVAYCEADHAATTREIIESCRLVRQVIDNALAGLPDLAADPRVQQRKDELISEAELLIGAIAEMGDDKSGDPLVSPAVLAAAVRTGLLDTPHLKGNPEGRGDILTTIHHGACYAVDPTSGRPMGEARRLELWRQQFRGYE